MARCRARGTWFAQSRRRSSGWTRGASRSTTAPRAYRRRASSRPPASLHRCWTSRDEDFRHSLDECDEPERAGGAGARSNHVLRSRVRRGRDAKTRIARRRRHAVRRADPGGDLQVQRAAGAGRDNRWSAISTGPSWEASSRDRQAVQPRFGRTRELLEIGKPPRVSGGPGSSGNGSAAAGSRHLNSRSRRPWRFFRR